MHTHRLRSLLFLALAVALGASCGDGDSTGPEDPESGSLSFSYSGAFSGTYDVSGAARFDATGFPRYGTWAVGGRNASSDLAVAAFRAGTAPRGDLFALGVPSITGPGSVTICDSLMDFDCDVAVALAFDIDPNGADSDQPFCLLSAGSIQVTSLTADRAIGGFSGTGICFTGPGNDAGAFAVSNGSFDVPLVAGLGVGGV